MIFTRLATYAARSARSRATYGSPFAGFRVVDEAVLRSPLSGGGESGGFGLGAVRGYLTAAGSGKAVARRARLADWDRIFGNPKFRRLFSGETPKKKNFENYRPKENKGAPKQNEKASTNSKEDPNAEENGNFQENIIRQFQNYIAPLIFLGLFLSSSSMGSSDKKEISFQEFRNKLLEPGLVDHILVSNKSVAEVYVRSSQQINNQMKDDDIQGPSADVPAKGNGGRYKFYFSIGSVDSFEEKLEEAQEALGIEPHDFIPVTYVSEVMWYSEFMKFAPIAVLLAILWGLGRRMQGGFGIGGGGAKGPRGIFNIGKAHITKLDKNSKNKVYFKDVAGCDEAKPEIMEFVHFLKNPKKYEDLGAKIPKG